MAYVVKFFVSREPSMPMQEVQSVTALAGKGLDGDRYALGTGSSNAWAKGINHVTLITLEAISFAQIKCRDLGCEELAFEPVDTRRNIVTCGMSIEDVLLGKEFLVGDVMMRGVSLCNPCNLVSKLVEKKDFKGLFAGRGGIRAEILSSGVISANDPIRLVEDIHR